jgi:glutathione S-transferase
MAVRRTRVLLIGSKNASSWSLRPWLALRMFNLPFQERVVPYATPQQKEQLRALSPSGLVPCMIEGDLTVWDSLAIIEHVADLFPDLQVWPQDRKARAIARSVSAEMHSGFHALRHEWPMNFAARGLSRPPTAAAERDIARIDAIWRQCREQFGNGGPFLFGAFSGADAMYAPVAARYATYRGASGDAVIDAYVAALMALKPMKEWATAAAVEVEAPEAA